jgi:outer membrane receptor for monomeric catechols
LFKTTNDLWVQGNSVGGGASVQKEPKTYVVGTTPGAPTAGEFTWSLPAFENSYVKLWINYGVTNQIDAGNGSPYISKGFSSDELTINNYDGGWKTGDVLDYILITP